MSKRAFSLVALVALGSAACVSNAPAATSGATGGTAGPIAVESSADACRVARTEVPKGTVTFAVTNTADAATEFYVYAEDGRKVMAEVEDIGPGLTRELVVDLQPGTYVTACKPGMVGEGIRGTLTVTE